MNIFLPRRREDAKKNVICHSGGVSPKNPLKFFEILRLWLRMTIKKSLLRAFAFSRFKIAGGAA